MYSLLNPKLQINHNGPAIKGVCVAERAEAGESNPSKRDMPSEAVVERSMARFLPSWYKLYGVDECRGTRSLNE